MSVRETPLYHLVVEYLFYHVIFKRVPDILEFLFLVPVPLVTIVVNVVSVLAVVIVTDILTYRPFSNRLLSIWYMLLAISNIINFIISNYTTASTYKAFRFPILKPWIVLNNTSEIFPEPLFRIVKYSSWLFRNFIFWNEFRTIHGLRMAERPKGLVRTCSCAAGTNKGGFAVSFCFIVLLTPLALSFFSLFTQEILYLHVYIYLKLFSVFLLYLVMFLIPVLPLFLHFFSS